MVMPNQGDLSPDLIAEAVKRAIAEIGKKYSPQDIQVKEKQGLDAAEDFPLGKKRPDLIKSASGLSLENITLEKVISGEIKFEDIKTHPQTLEYQAQIAESVGRPRISANLRRAAEMTRIPDERVLEIYNSLRPYRCTKQELLDIAQELESKFDALTCAAFVREAADIYEKRNRLKQ